MRATIADGAADRPADLVGRNFTASAPNRLWVMDFTYVPTWTGTAFTASVTDVCSRRVVDWRIASRMPTEAPLSALEMALWTRAREGATTAGAVASIGTVGDSFDYSLAESVIGLYKNECVKHDGSFRTVDDLELGTLSWVQLGEQVSA